MLKAGERKLLKEFIKLSFDEDGVNNDITTSLTVPSFLKIKAVIFAREDGVFCGEDVLREIFSLKNKLKLTLYRRDAQRFKKGEKIALISGLAHLILSRERVALNFISRLSGIASLTYKFVEKVKNTRAKIMDTRKTTPGLRFLEKYAVVCGGGNNHRYNLSECILIKDNHLRACSLFSGNKFAFWENFSFSFKKNKILPIEIEVENYKEFIEVIHKKPSVIMLDNFSFLQLKKAVQYRDKFFPQILLEASGGVKLSNVEKIARSGVDFISVGELTHSAPSCDFSLEII